MHRQQKQKQRDHYNYCCYNYYYTSPILAYKLWSDISAGWALTIIEQIPNQVGCPMLICHFELVLQATTTDGFLDLRRGTCHWVVVVVVLPLMVIVIVDGGKQRKKRWEGGRVQVLKTSWGWKWHEFCKRRRSSNNGKSRGKAVIIIEKR